jgi:hypothetical protein
MPPTNKRKPAPPAPAKTVPDHVLVAAARDIHEGELKDVKVFGGHVTGLNDKRQVVTFIRASLEERIKAKHGADAFEGFDAGDDEPADEGDGGETPGPAEADPK